MSKRIEINGKFYRMRRGKLVEIPMQWLNKVPSKSTIADRRVKKHCRKRNKTRIKNSLCKISNGL